MSDKVYARVQEAVGTFCAKYGLPPAYLDLTYEALFRLNLEVASGETNPGEDWPNTYLGMAINQNESLPPENGAEYGFKMTRHPADYLFEFWVPSNKTAGVPAAPQDNRNDVPSEIPKPKDSGVRQHFDTGSQRDTQVGKGRFDLLPVRALRLLAIHFENGAEKYQARNWEKGQPLSRYMNSGIRHAFLHLMGKRDEPHLIAAIWNFMCCVDTEARVNEGLLPKELNDLPESK